MPTEQANPQAPESGFAETRPGLRSADGPDLRREVLVMPPSHRLLAAVCYVPLVLVPYLSLIVLAFRFPILLIPATPMLILLTPTLVNCAHAIGQSILHGRPPGLIQSGFATKRLWVGGVRDPVVQGLASEGPPAFPTSPPPNLLQGVPPAIPLTPPGSSEEPPAA